MCGIAGFIGNSTDPEATFDLINQLMIKTEVRGDHATGFWATMGHDDNRVIYHKEPIKSSEFVKHDLWQSLQEHKTNLLIGHCRFTSPGVGHEKINKNNHPHVSKDCRVALVHNGKIPEYTHLKKKYDVITECDSEILLRIFESGESYHDQIEHLRKEMPKIWENTPAELLHRIYGLKKLFSEVNYGAMAVAIGERLNSDLRSLILFRNESRPICVIDLRKVLGQIFFCSTPEIFRAAVEDCTIAKEIIPDNQPVYPELPSYSIYSFIFDEKKEEFSIRVMKVNRTRRYGYWAQTEEPKEIPKSTTALTKTRIDVVSSLTDEEDVIESTPAKTSQVDNNHSINATYTTPLVPVPDALSLANKLLATDKRPYTCYGDDDDSDSADPDPEEVAGSGSVNRREEPVSSSILKTGFQELTKTVDEDNDAASEFLEIQRLGEDTTKIVYQAECLINSIGVLVYNKIQETSITKDTIESILDSMSAILQDLQSVENMVK